jgi:hypothetical protein
MASFGWVYLQSCRWLRISIHILPKALGAINSKKKLVSKLDGKYAKFRPLFQIKYPIFLCPFNNPIRWSFCKRKKTALKLDGKLKSNFFFWNFSLLHQFHVKKVNNSYIITLCIFLRNFPKEFIKKQPHQYQRKNSLSLYK